MNRRSMQPAGQPWDDERLAGAYRELAAGRAPADLAAATLVAVQAVDGRGEPRR